MLNKVLCFKVRDAISTRKFRLNDKLNHILLRFLIVLNYLHNWLYGTQHWFRLHISYDIKLSAFWRMNDHLLLENKDTCVLFTYLNPCSAFLKEYQKICILLIPTQAAKCLTHGFNSTNQGQRKVTDQFQEYSNRICCSLCLISLDPLTDRNDS